MIRYILRTSVIALSIISLVVVPVHADTAFTYQGELMQNGSPADGDYDLAFALWNSLNGGSQIGPTVALDNVAVSNGRFTVELDFGFDAFDVGDRWLAVSVNATALSPRQPINAAPFAIKTRGMYVNEDESFVGVGRSYRITSAETFGIHKNTAGFGGMYVETGTDGEPFYGYSRNGSVDAYHYFDSATAQWRLYVGGNRMVVDQATGDIGLGTTSPEVSLHVVSDGQGDINGEEVILGHCTDTADFSVGVLGRSDGPDGWGVYGWANADTGTGKGVVGVSNSRDGYDFFAFGVGLNYGASSSIRWKDNIENIPQPLDKIAHLRGVYFDWDKDHGGHHDIGMIAEEVGAVLPEIVNYEENGIDAIGMDYSKLTPLLVEAVNALRAEKDAEIEALRAEKDHAILELTNRLAELEKLLMRMTREQIK